MIRQTSTYNPITFNLIDFKEYSHGIQVHHEVYDKNGFMIYKNDSLRVIEFHKCTTNDKDFQIGDIVMKADTPMADYHKGIFNYYRVTGIEYNRLSQDDDDRIIHGTMIIPFHDYSIIYFNNDELIRIYRRHSYIDVTPNIRFR